MIGFEGKSQGMVMPFKDKDKRNEYMRNYRKLHRPYSINSYLMPDNTLVITGECKLCGQFPCKHTGLAISNELGKYVHFREVKTK